MPLKVCVSRDWEGGSLAPSPPPPHPPPTHTYINCCNYVLQNFPIIFYISIATTLRQEGRVVSLFMTILMSVILQTITVVGRPYASLSLKHNIIPLSSNPSCLQATRASLVPQKSSHTVPQTLLLHISTRPLVAVPP